ncbi:hypothetical protein F4778DRAFT_750337 [Xylariomycetidae sp. FL2044]|nr:hypothetical protein F4778DRAFT_750337 [Xylariomycetidae sp. FL2044]
MVSVNGDEYFVPAGGDTQYLMLNDAVGTEFTLAPDRVVIGGTEFLVPSAPLPTSTDVSKGGYSVQFRSRSPPPSTELQPADSAEGRAFARQVAEDYISFAGSVKEANAHFFKAVFDFFARYSAAGDEADKWLGTTDQAIDLMGNTATILSTLFKDIREENWDTFLYQVSLLDTPEDEDEDEGDNDDPTDDGPEGDSCENTPEPGIDLPPLPASGPTSASQYINTAFADLHGIENLCQRVPWRHEALMNAARFLSRSQWSSRARLIEWMRTRETSFLSNQPQGFDGLASGAGVMVSGIAAWQMVSQITMPTSTEFSGARTWYMKFEQHNGTHFLWYYNYTTTFLDGGKGDAVGTSLDYNSTGYGYLFGMASLQGYPTVHALTNVKGLIAWDAVKPSAKENEELIARGVRNVDDPSYDNRDTLPTGPPRARRTSPPRRPDARRRQPSSCAPPQRRQYVYDNVPPAKEHQRLISARNGQSLRHQGYGYDTSQGLNVGMIIIDSGVNLDNGNVRLTSLWR